MKRLLVAAGTVGCLVADSAYLLTDSAQAATRPGATAGAAAFTLPSATYTPPPISWSACTDATLQALNAQCGLLTVPLDYTHPSGTKIKIAVSEIKHTSSAATYQGAVVVNLTNPGGSALSQSAMSQLLPSAINSEYDWIGIDPRGVGASQPALSCDPTISSYDQPAFVPTSKAALSTWIKRSEDYAADCGKTHNELLDHVTTADSAMDLDTLRKALGQEKLNYYGYFYGAYLGEVYATLYPNRVRRMILDSSIDPKKVWFGFNLGQNGPLNQNFGAFSAWAAKYDGVYHLGTTKAAVEAKYYAALAKLSKTPAGGTLGPDVWTDDFLLAYNTSNWKNLAGVFSAYVNGGDYAPMKALFDGSYSATNDNAFAMSLAVECTDTSWPKKWHSWVDATRKDYREAPFASWADTWFVAPCQSWPAPAHQPVKVDGSKAPPMLMVLDTTLAPSATFSGSLAVRDLFPSAVLVNSGATPAGTATADSCSPGESIAEYLADGTLPARVPGRTADLKCPANPLPNPTSGAAASGTKS